MSFREPHWLWLLGAIPFALLFFVVRERARRELANRFVSESLRRPRFVVRALRPAALSVALALGVIALAGPQWGRERIEVRGSTSNRVIILDESSSMLAEDVGTTRLVAAKALARRIIDSHEGRVALIVFEGSAQIVSPLTTDKDAVATLLDSIEAGETGEPGSNVAASIREALKLVDQRTAESTDFVLISDGEERGGKAVPAAEEAGARRIPIRTITIGTPSGASIAVRDETGRQVVTRADAGTMAAIARASGGRSYVNPFSAEISSEVSSAIGRTANAAPEEVEIPIERFQWPLAASLLFFCLGSIAQRGAE